jgi:hypothetical protein
VSPTLEAAAAGGGALSDTEREREQRSARLARPPHGFAGKGVPANRVPAIFRPITLGEGELGPGGSGLVVAGAGAGAGAGASASAGQARSSSTQRERGGGSGGGSAGGGPRLLVLGAGTSLDVSAVDIGGEPAADAAAAAGGAAGELAPPMSPLRVGELMRGKR